MDIHKFFTESEVIITQAIESGVIPGGVLGVNAGGSSQVKAFGSSSYSLTQFRSRWDNNLPYEFESTEESRGLCDSIYESEPSRIIQTNSIYDCASITKSIPLALIVLRFFEKGIIHKDQEVGDFIEGCSDDIGSCSIWNLLTHTVDFKFSLGSVARSGESVLDAILLRAFDESPGQVYCYSNSSSILLSLILEKVSGKPFELLAKEEVFDPLEMKDSSFRDDRAQAVEYCPWRNQVVRGQVHDESAYSLLPMNTGAAGMFSSVPDLLKALSILQKCFQGDSNYLSCSTIESLLVNQIPSLATTSLGMEFKEPRFMGAMGQELKALGKTGFTGCHWQWAPESDIAIVFLSNYPWPRRLENAEAINIVRKQLGDCAIKC